MRTLAARPRPVFIVVYDGSVADPFAAPPSPKAPAPARPRQGNVRRRSGWSKPPPLFPLVFTDPDVASELRQGFIAVAIDSRTEKQLLTGLEIKQLPTYIFRLADGREYQRLEGDFFRPAYIARQLRELRKLEAKANHPLEEGE